MSETQANGAMGNELDGVRIFVGNLPFKTRQEDLVTLFEEFGEVKAARLAYRFRRPLGYAFVTLAEPSAANAALVKLHNMEYNGRNLNVELAKPESANTPESRAANGDANAERRRRPRGPRKPRAEEAGSSDDDAAKRATQPRRRNFGGEGAEEGQGDDAQATSRPRRRGPRTEGGAGTAAAGEGADNAQQDTEAREARRQRIRDIQKERAAKRSDLPDSETQVFVSNIPYSYTEDDITKAFENLAISNVRVVRTNSGKSRGFCFIDFATKEEQQRALEEIQHKQLEGRSVSVRVAKIEPERPAEAADEQ